MPDYSYENRYYDRGCSFVAGTDEAGRGPLCGSVCAAAVILPRDLAIPGLNDSKKLTEKKREALYDVILSQAVSYGIAFSSVEEIEEYNILGASQLAMRRAAAMLDPQPEILLVDGNIARGFHLPTETIVGGDGLSMSIAAASVLAKVSRDRLCREWDERYPQYGIAKHKGYATKAHIEALRKYGPSPIHRLSFLKGILAGTPYAF